MKSLGTLLFLAGACIAAYYFFVFDTSVAVPGGEILGIYRVNNLGLMDDRRNGLIFGTGLLIVGGVLLSSGSRRGADGELSTAATKSNGSARALLIGASLIVGVGIFASMSRHRSDGEPPSYPSTPTATATNSASSAPSSDAPSSEVRDSSASDDTEPSVTVREKPAKHRKEDRPSVSRDLDVQNVQNVSEDKYGIGARTRYITGTVVNKSKTHTYQGVSVEIGLYDDAENLVGSTMDTAMSIEPGETWEFKAVVIEDSATKYKLKRIQAMPDPFELLKSSTNERDE